MQAGTFIVGCALDEVSPDFPCEASEGLLIQHPSLKLDLIAVEFVDCAITGGKSEALLPQQPFLHGGLDAFCVITGLGCSQQPFVPRALDVFCIIAGLGCPQQPFLPHSALDGVGTTGCVSEHVSEQPSTVSENLLVQHPFLQLDFIAFEYVDCIIVGGYSEALF